MANAPQVHLPKRRGGTFAQTRGFPRMLCRAGATQTDDQSSRRFRPHSPERSGSLASDPQQNTGKAAIYATTHVCDTVLLVCGGGPFHPEPNPCRCRRSTGQGLLPTYPPAGFGDLGFGFWIPGFGFRTLDFGCWFLGFGFWILDLGFWESGLGYRALGLRFWVLDFGKLARLRTTSPPGPPDQTWTPPSRRSTPTKKPGPCSGGSLAFLREYVHGCVRAALIRGRGRLSRRPGKCKSTMSRMRLRCLGA